MAKGQCLLRRTRRKKSKTVPTYHKHLSILVASFVLLFLAACSESTPSAPVSYPDMDSVAARLYQSKCSVCHVAPQPSAHTERLWPGVIQRMQMRMQAKGIVPLNKNELGEILDYLQSHAAAKETK